MNPGIAEEASKVAATTVEALKQTPMILALVIFNVLFIGAMIYVSIKTGERWDHEIERWAELAKSCQGLKTSP
jgi:hypothetical protein